MAKNVKMYYPEEKLLSNFKNDYFENSKILGSPLHGDASPSGGAKEILVCQDPKKFQGGDADEDTDDGSTDGHEGWNSYVDGSKFSLKIKQCLSNILKIF